MSLPNKDDSPPTAPAPKPNLAAVDILPPVPNNPPRIPAVPFVPAAAVAAHPPTAGNPATGAIAGAPTIAAFAAGPNAPSAAPPVPITASGINTSGLVTFFTALDTEPITDDTP